VFIAAPVAVFVPELDDVFAGVLELDVPLPEPDDPERADEADELEVPVDRDD
jgi:hypothetical protein